MACRAGCRNDIRHLPAVSVPEVDEPDDPEEVLEPVVPWSRYRWIPAAYHRFGTIHRLRSNHQRIRLRSRYPSFRPSATRRLAAVWVVPEAPNHSNRKHRPCPVVVSGVFVDGSLPVVPSSVPAAPSSGSRSRSPPSTGPDRPLGIGPVHPVAHHAVGPLPLGHGQDDARGHCHRNQSAADGRPVWRHVWPLPTSRIRVAGSHPTGCGRLPSPPMTRHRAVMRMRCHAPPALWPGHRLCGGHGFGSGFGDGIQPRGRIIGRRGRFTVRASTPSAPSVAWNGTAFCSFSDDALSTFW